MQRLQQLPFFLGDPAFDCPETRKQFPLENFSCQDKIYNGLMAQTLANPIGSTYVYSDLRHTTLFLPIKPNHSFSQLHYADVCCRRGGQSTQLRRPEISLPWLRPGRTWVLFYCTHNLTILTNAFSPERCNVISRPT
mgnify:CR=1 FL=1